MKFKTASVLPALDGTVTGSDCQKLMLSTPPARAIIAIDIVSDSTCRMTTSTSNTANNIEAGTGYTIWEKHETSKYHMSKLSVTGYQVRSGTVTDSQYNACWSIAGSLTDPSTTDCTYATHTSLTTKSNHQYAPSKSVDFYSIASMKYTPTSGSTKHNADDVEYCLGRCLLDPLNCVAFSFAAKANVATENCYTHHATAERSPTPSTTDGMFWS
jgi:hypothetical protein